MSHPSTLPVPQFGDKLKLLLLFNSKNQEWLASTLRLTPANITRWKKEDRVPALHARAMCAQLGIPLELLLSPDLDAFQAELGNRFSVGSGERWKRFAGTAQMNPALLRLERLRAAAPEPQRLARLDFRPQSEPSALARLPRIPVGERVRIALAGSSAAAFGRNAGHPSVIVLAEDAEGVGCLCPSADAESMVEKDGDWWLPAPGKPGLHVNGPPGRHAILLLMAGQPLPAEITRALSKDQLSWGLDRTVEWLHTANVQHQFVKSEFLVV